MIATIDSAVADIVARNLDDSRVAVVPTSSLDEAAVEEAVLRRTLA